MNIFNFIPLEYYTITGFINFITSLSLGILVLKHSRVLSNKLFSYYTFSISFWSLFYFIWLLSDTPKHAEFYLRTCMIGVVFIPSIYFHFTVEFLNIKNKQKLVIFNYFFSAISIPLLYTTLYAKDLEPFLKIPYWLHTGPFFHIVLFHFGAIMLYSFYLLLYYGRKEVGMHKNQIMYVMVSTAIGFVGGWTNYFSWYRIPVPPFLNILVSVFVAGVAYAIVKHHLMDIKLAWRKSTIYFIYIITTTAMLIYLAILFRFQAQIVVFLFIAGITIAVFTKDIFVSFLSRIVLRDYETVLGELNDIISDNTIFYKIGNLITFLTRNIRKIMGVENCYFLTLKKEADAFMVYKELSNEDDCPIQIPRNNVLAKTLNYYKRPIVKELISSKMAENKHDVRELKQNMDRLKIEVAVPFFVDQKLHGIMLLGYKKDNSLFNDEEVKRLDILAKAKEQNFALALLIESQEELVLISRRISETEDMEELGKYLVQVMMRVSNSTQSAIFLSSPKRNKYNCSYYKGIDNAVIEINEEEYLIQILNDRRKPLFFKDIKEWAEKSELVDINKAFELMKKLKAEMIIPILSGGLLGFFVLGEKRTGEDYDRNDWSSCRALIETATAKIVNINLVEKSQRDALTSLYNKEKVQSWLSDIIQESIKTKKPFAVMMIDGDYFKRINDTKGHPYGDKVLIELSETLVRAGRPTDLVFRIGGEEFLVVLIASGEEGIRIYYDRLTEMMKKGKYINEMTISAGASVFNPDIKEERDYALHNTDIIRMKLIQTSDDEAYRAKQEGRNRLCYGGEIKESEILTEEGEYKYRVEVLGQDLGEMERVDELLKAFGVDVSFGEIRKGLEVFKDDKPDGVMILLEKDYNIEELKSAIKDLKKRRVSLNIAIVSYDGELRSKLEKEDIIIDRYLVAPIDKALIADWVRSVCEIM
ncbi:MAG: diguanylate cyclase [Elusimicrobiota bacterium]